jgi:outer membrane protein TolC
MKSKWIGIVLWMLVVFSSNASAQDSLFTYYGFIDQVLQAHPEARQADLLLEEAEAYVRKARGGFDPVLSADYDKKQFDDKNYYQINDNQLRIPTWLGAEFVGGYERNNGNFLNPEQFVPDEGLAYAGVSVNIGQGLFIDERRRDLAIAKTNVTLLEAERAGRRNDLVMEATAAYWSWVYQWLQEQVYVEALEIALDRFVGLKESFVQGDIPAIDTLEAYIQVQSRQIMLREAQADHRQAYFRLADFLWLEPAERLNLICCPEPQEAELSDIAIFLAEVDLPTLRTRIEAQHPAIQMYDQKLNVLQIERRWQAEKLKPKLNLKYNVLNEPVNGDIAEGYNANDYKFGVSFEMPLLLRKSRGELQLTKLKQQNTLLDRNYKLAQLHNKFDAYFYQLDALQDQLDNVVENVRLSERLLEAERIKFEMGESSIFLINTREMSLINYRLKMAELQAKILKTIATVQYTAGGFDSLMARDGM